MKHTTVCVRKSRGFFLYINIKADGTYSNQCVLNGSSNQMLRESYLKINCDSAFIILLTQVFKIEVGHFVLLKQTEGKTEFSAELSMS
jgi:hypothetical protein